MRAVTVVLAVVMAVGSGSAPVATQGGQIPQGDGVRLLLTRLERVVQQSDATAYETLLADSTDRGRATAFARSELAPGMTRVVVQERDRSPLAGTLPGNGYRLVLDAFEEFGGRARSATWQLDIKRVGETGADTEWLIADQQRLSSVENLYRLSLNPEKQFAAHDLKISDVDLDLTLTDGSVFVSDIDPGTTAVLLVGRGDLRFHPAPETEKSQVKIFSGAEAIETRFDVAYLRINPVDFDRLISTRQLAAAVVDPREFRRADKVFREESAKSYSLELGDLSHDLWSLVPSAGDLVADIHTRRFDTLTYTHASAEPEDISLFDRGRRKTIALYSSQQKDRRGTPGVVGEDRGDYEVLHYDIALSATPERRWLEGRVRMAVRVRANAISSLTLRLANAFVVQSIVSDEYGRLFSMRVKGQNSVVVNLPATLLRGTDLTLTVTYAGRLEPQTLDTETIALQQSGAPPQGVTIGTMRMTAEPSFLYSNQSNWYPQPATGNYATATLRIMVPADLDCVASGELEAGSPTQVPANDSSPPRKLYVFNAAQPLRYFAFIVSRFVTAETFAIGFPPVALNASERPSAAPIGTSYRVLNVSVEASPRQMNRGREISDRTVDIALFYQSLLDDSPYPTFTVALVESELPGGHSPGYFAALNQPLPASSFSWRGDPAAFDNYPDFFLAHELAHQWWGQAVGWRTYHEQWLSEGFSQYFSALYAQRQGGDEVFASVMRQMRRWAIEESAEGPISLGYRLGHIRGDSRVFRALVYNKGAVVLHMLRRLVGDEAFFRGLRRFYWTSRFRNAGTADLKAAMEAETGRTLARFFDRWIDGSALPRLKFSYRVDGADVVLHIEQIGELFDLPVDVTLQYADRKSADVLVPVIDRIVDLRVPLAGVLRAADISKNDASLAQIVKN